MQNPNTPTAADAEAARAALAAGLGGGATATDVGKEALVRWLSQALSARAGEENGGSGNGHAAPAGAVNGNGHAAAAAAAGEAAQQWSGVLKQAEAGAVAYYVVVGTKA